MRLTRRGWGVLAVAVVGFLLAARFGARSLNAVVAPALLVLVLGVLLVARRPQPTVTRTAPAPGFPGEVRTVELDVDCAGPHRLAESTSDGLRPVEPAVWVPETGAVELAVEFVSRGEQHLGPTTLYAEDPFGVVADETVVSDRTPVLVYPRLDSVAPSRELSGLVEGIAIPERDAFDGLREYAPGDPMRNVHWASSAKRHPGEMVVTEFAAGDDDGVTLAAAADAGHADEMAAAAASLAVYVLDSGLTVGVVAPEGSVREGRGDEQRDRILELLARTDAGRVSERAEADVRVFAGDDGVTVRAGDVTFSYGEVIGETAPAAAVVG